MNITEFVNSNSIPHVLPKRMKGGVDVGLNVYCRPTTGGYSLGHGISPLVTLSPHMGRDPSKKFLANTRRWEELESSMACKELGKLQKMVKDCCERVTITIMAFKMSASLVVNNYATEGNLHHDKTQEKDCSKSKSSVGL